MAFRVLLTTVLFTAGGIYLIYLVRNSANRRVSRYLAEFQRCPQCGKKNARYYITAGEEIIEYDRDTGKNHRHYEHIAYARCGSCGKTIKSTAVSTLISGYYHSGSSYPEVQARRDYPQGGTYYHDGAPDQEVTTGSFEGMIRESDEHTGCERSTADVAMILVGVMMILVAVGYAIYYFFT